MIPQKLAALFRPKRVESDARNALLMAVLVWPPPKDMHVSASVCACDNDVRVDLKFRGYVAYIYLPTSTSPADVPRALDEAAALFREKVPKVPADPFRGTSFEVPEQPFGPPPILTRPMVPVPTDSRPVTVESAIVSHLVEISRRHAHLVAQLRRHAEADGNVAVISAFETEIEEIRKLATVAEGALSR